MARRCGGTAVQCGARQCNAEAVWCAQQQPIALNPGVDGADLANLEAHPLERACRTASKEALRLSALCVPPDN